MSELQEPFEVQVVPRDIRSLANRLYGSCNDDDPDDEQLLDEAELLQDLFTQQARTASDKEDIPFQFFAVVAQTLTVFFDWDRIPKLLELLAEMERIRQDVSERAQARLLAYEIHVHQHPDSHVNVGLDEPERNELEWWTNSSTSSALRKEYHLISLQLREHHVVRSLANRDPEEYEQLRMLYFPQDYSASHEIFHQGLSHAELEKERLRAVASDIRGVWEGWEDDRAQWFRKHFPNISDELLYGNAEYLSYKDAFAKRFLHAHSIENVVRTQVRNWIRMVERHLEILEGLYDTGGVRHSTAADGAAATSSKKKRRKTGSIASRSNQKRPRFSLADTLPSSRRTSVVKSEPE